MTTATVTKPTLREALVDALDIAYWHHRNEVEACGACAKNPAGVASCHREDNDAAFFYDEARKQLQRNPESPEVLAVLGGAA